MTTPVSGAISFQDLFNEFRGTGVGAVYSLSMADIYNSSNLVTGTVAVTTSVSIGGGNIITWSEQFDNARWNTILNVSVSPNQATAPDGTTTADRITVTIAGGSALRQLDVTTIAPNVLYTHSLYVKGFGSSVGAIVQIFNNNNGSTVGSAQATLTADWQRISASFTGNATTNRNITIQTNGAVGSLAPNQSVDVWGYQITTGSTLYSYVATTGITIGESFINVPTGAYTTTSVVARGAISMSQFYGITQVQGAAAPSRTSIVITVASNTFTSNLNLYNIALRSGYSTGLTDVVLYVSSNALVGSAGSSYTETVSISLSSGSGAYTQGNLVNNSGNMSDGAYWQGGFNNQVTTSVSIVNGVYGIVSPNGTTTGILAMTQTNVSGNDYWQQNQTLMNATTTYCISVWARGFGSSIGQKVSVGSAQGQSAITLTAGWQRMITNVGGSGAQRWLMYTNGGAAVGVYTNNLLLSNQTVFLWGPQITTSVSTTANQQYVETTGSYLSPAGAPTLTGSYNIYTTSETLTTSYAVAVPARFNSGDTVTIINNGFIVGESGKGGQGGSAAAAPVAGYPAPQTGKVGGRGGDALGVFRPVIIDNTGTIGGGGGGGGGGGAGPGTTPKAAATTYSGGSGGGGAGADSNPGFKDINSSLPSTAPAPSPANSYTVSPTVTFTVGTGGIRVIGATSTATPGANGGAIGTTGSTSTASPLGAAQPGGAPGHYVVGSPLVTWTSTGTRSGSVG